MSTSTNDDSGDRKSPDPPLRGKEALERMRQDHEAKRQSAKPEKDCTTRGLRSELVVRPAGRSVTDFYPGSRRLDISSKETKPIKRLTKNDRITLWGRLISGIPKHLADLHNAEIDAQLAERQSSSEFGTAPQGLTTSDNNQSTETRPREESQGQNKKSWLESFRSWLRRRKSMTTQAASGSGTGGSDAAGTLAASATGAAASPPSAPTASSIRSWWHPIWSLGTVAVIALVIICFAGFYCFRDQNVVSEFKEIARRHDQLAEERRNYESHRAEAEANAAEIRARGGSITTGVPVFNYNINIYMTNSPGHVPNP